MTTAPGSQRLLIGTICALMACALLGRPRARAQAQVAAPPQLAPAARSSVGSPSRGDRWRAKLLHDQAQIDYRQGRLELAIQKFARAHELAGEPILLFNIAQAYRRLGHRRLAVSHYRRFLEG